jgi:hypothetical protein
MGERRTLGVASSTRTRNAVHRETLHGLEKMRGTEVVAGVDLLLCHSNQSVVTRKKDQNPVP